VTGRKMEVGRSKHIKKEVCMYKIKKACSRVKYACVLKKSMYDKKILMYELKCACGIKKYACI